MEIAGRGIKVLFLLLACGCEENNTRVVVFFSLSSFSWSFFFAYVIERLFMDTRKKTSIRFAITLLFFVPLGGSEVTK